ncbi:hypothetical protein C8R44DRAFT_881870 [Mycena epipterygia]|nr:hypothetical protein C8R44DRAFT_881870 [Mycena epipterygia]
MALNTPKTPLPGLNSLRATRPGSCSLSAPAAHLAAVTLISSGGSRLHVSARIRGAAGSNEEQKLLLRLLAGRIPSPSSSQSGVQRRTGMPRPCEYADRERGIAVLKGWAARPRVEAEVLLPSLHRIRDACRWYAMRRSSIRQSEPAACGMVTVLQSHSITLWSDSSHGPR